MSEAKCQSKKCRGASSVVYVKHFLTLRKVQTFGYSLDPRMAVVNQESYAEPGNYFGSNLLYSSPQQNLH